MFRVCFPILQLLLEIFIISFNFSDFEVPNKALKTPSRPVVSAPSCDPPSRQFPVAPCPIAVMNRNQAAVYAPQLVDFLCEPQQKRGEGECVEWEMKVEAKLLGEKTRKLLKLKCDDQISLADIRSWNPGMKLPGSVSFKQGPGKNDNLWLKAISWSSFLKVIVEVISAIFGQNAVESDALSATLPSESSRPAPASTCPTPAPASTRPPPAPASTRPPPAPASTRPPTAPASTRLPPAPSSVRHPSSMPSSRAAEAQSAQALQKILTGPGPLSDCLTDWVVHHPHLTLSVLPLDVSHPPRLQVFFFESFVICDGC